MPCFSSERGDSHKQTKFGKLNTFYRTHNTEEIDNDNNQPGCRAQCVLVHCEESMQNCPNKISETVELQKVNRFIVRDQCSFFQL